MLHTMSPQAKKIAFHDGDMHRFRPDIDPDFVGLSLPLLYDDLWTAIARFLADERRGPKYELVQARFGEMFRFIPFSLLAE
jgi:hypothetical protein